MLGRDRFQFLLLFTSTKYFAVTYSVQLSFRLEINYRHILDFNKIEPRRAYKGLWNEKFLYTC